MSQLPIKLNNAPIVDVIFELRFSSNIPMASNILSGILYNTIASPNKNILQLPASNIPAPVRQADVSMRYIALIKILWDNFFLSIGDDVLIIGCQLPYVGWDKFSPEILNIPNVIKDVKIFNNIERFSVKYVNLIENKYLSTPRKALNIDLSMPNLHHDSETGFAVRFESQKDKITEIVSIVSNKKISVNGQSEIEGVFIDIDSIFQSFDGKSLQEKFCEVENNLEIIKGNAKSRFYSIISEGTLEALEPEYIEG